MEYWKIRNGLIQYKRTVSWTHKNRIKGSPGIFLLALQKMKEQPENAIVIDNSYTAMKGAIKAGCLPISFLSRERYENSD